MVFTLALNGCSSILFPLMAMNPHAPAGYALRYMGAHATSVFAANAFVLLFCVALQGVLMNVVSTRHFQWISRTVQLFLLFLFVCLFFLLPRTVFVRERIKSRQQPFHSILPPMWFTGLYETLQGRDHLGFQALASLAGQALAGALAMFTLTYMASFRRHVRRSLESSNTVLPSTAEWTRGVLQRLDKLVSKKSGRTRCLSFRLSNDSAQFTASIVSGRLCRSGIGFDSGGHCKHRFALCRCGHRAV